MTEPNAFRTARLVSKDEAEAEGLDSLKLLLSLDFLLRSHNFAGAGSAEEHWQELETFPSE